MKTFIFFVLCFLLCAGCETARQGAQEVGRPIGGAMKAVGGVTEGAVEGYTDEDTDNPYNR
jgi:hypothetical protein